MAQPRMVPDRDSKYMGLAWMYASFSKDPSTQVGACIVTEDNYPLGMGYNGPPRIVDDNQISWDRPTKDAPDAFSKYDIIIHAEGNALDHCSEDPAGAILYVTALPCPVCMREILRNKLKRVVYMDYQSGNSSSLQNAAWREKSFYLAELGRIEMRQFGGNIGWIPDWTAKLQQMGVFDL